MKKILITGAAGFIGFHLSNLLLKKGFNIVGIDSIEESYGKAIKKQRIFSLNKNKNFKFYKSSINQIDKIKGKIDLIIHLAAEAGVRKSLLNPYFYIDQNINQTIRVFEYARKNKINKVFYASSSSVYGNNNIYPSNEKMSITKPLSIYGITKIASENIAYYYKEIFNINSYGLRFFTVYGPFGRPDMSIFIFFKNILQNKLITLNNYGKNLRDYTYVDDVTMFIEKLIKKSINQKKFFNIFNIGGKRNISLLNVIKLIEKITDKKAKLKLVEKNKLDPFNSLASMKKLEKFVNFKKSTKIEDGLKITFSWIKTYLKN
ncbi:NAD-dependent epimerase/dehydratase family protein [Candidatus Pelagibacter sp.]|jgi:UDP-glucuronate 4-epimerase|nr:NAD-dependent epimerase/dehydratase family protein [Candidatus Pelagibacter sp.]